MKGIDISAWQENVDWQAVVDFGVEFVIIKIGESYQLDSMFIDHINSAVAHGLKVGVYYYSHAINDTQAEFEAGWVGAQIQEYLNGNQPEMGIWYDMEDSSIVDFEADITVLCSTFIERMQSFGYTYVGVYSSYNWLVNGNIDTDQLNVPYWCAQYNYQCDFEHPSLKIWQYTDALNINGQLFDGNEYLA